MKFRQTLYVRTTRATVLAILICAGIALSDVRLEEPLRAAPARRIGVQGTLPLTFERVKAGVYTARSRGYDVKISSDEVIVTLAGGEAMPSARIRMSFVDAAPGVVVPEARVDARGAHRRPRRPGWLPNVRTYSRVRMNAIHAGIDVAFYGSDRQLEYELHVAPAGSPDRVAMAFEGADAVGLDASGDVVVSAAGRYLRMGRPAAYQKVNGALTPVAVEYVVRDHTARLVLGEYDRTRPLVIHPAP